MQIATYNQLNTTPGNSAADQSKTAESNSFAAIFSEQNNRHNIASQQASGSTIDSTAKQTTSSVASNQKTLLNTNHGEVPLNIDDYFSSKSTSGPIDLDSIPLLLPTEQNIEALSQHSSEELRKLLNDYGIPHAPQQITFNNSGEIQFPSDYPYGNELKLALEDNPALERELHTVSALSSHYVAMQERQPFIEEMSRARTQAEIDNIIGRYNYLLNNNHGYKEIALTFSADGNMNVTADGQPYNLT